MKIVYLTPKSSYRDNLRSDSLWGIICWGIRHLYSEKILEDFISHYDREENVVKISSAFPFVVNEKNKKVKLFPKPIIRPLAFNNSIDISKSERVTKLNRLKKFKGQKLVHEEIFYKYLRGELSDSDYFHSEKEWIAKDFLKVEKTDILHNTIHRLTGSTLEGALFTKEETFIARGGIYFLLDGDSKYIELVLSALRLYSHIGMMGDSSIGKGHFDISFEEFTSKFQQDAEYFITLSLYHPTRDETGFYSINKEFCFYETEVRKGKLSSAHLGKNDFWKDSILLFKEGSVFKKPANNKIGQNKIVKQRNDIHNFDIRHFGIAFNLPIKVRQ